MKKRLLFGALITLVLFPAVGWALLKFTHQDAATLLLRSNTHIFNEIIIGSISGIVMGFGAKKIIQLNLLRQVETKYARMIGNLNLKRIDVIFISFCAGFGEELLFRGAIQPYLGIWITAIIFVAIHGYLNPKNFKITIYGIYMSIAIAGLGYLTDYIGILSACIAHMVIDILLFSHLIAVNQKNEFGSI